MSGKNDVARKLPKRYRERWATKCDNYKMDNKVSYVPFSIFTKYLRDLARLKIDPSLMIENLPQTPTGRFTARKNRSQVLTVKKVDVASDRNEPVASHKN